MIVEIFLSQIMWFVLIAAFAGVCWYTCHMPFPPDADTPSPDEIYDMKAYNEERGRRALSLILAIVQKAGEEDLCACRFPSPDFHDTSCLKCSKKLPHASEQVSRQR